mmetsp:Transcript_66537/g.194723  ORF Transcript_66537/g.194723 Transcript_66537/m.194723 type:complete len:161 (+) Transcript_66537:251-733(+)
MSKPSTPTLLRFDCLGPENRDDRLSDGDWTWITLNRLPLALALPAAWCIGRGGWLSPKLPPRSVLLLGGALADATEDRGLGAEVRPSRGPPPVLPLTDLWKAAPRFSGSASRELAAWSGDGKSAVLVLELGVVGVTAKLGRRYEGPRNAPELEAVDPCFR